MPMCLDSTNAQPVDVTKRGLYLQVWEEIEGRPSQLYLQTGGYLPLTPSFVDRSGKIELT